MIDELGSKQKRMKATMLVAAAAAVTAAAVMTGKHPSTLQDSTPKAGSLPACLPGRGWAGLGSLALPHVPHVYIWRLIMG